MAFEIVLKQRYLNKLVNTLEYLEKEYGHNIALDFLAIIDRKIIVLKHHPLIGAPSGLKDVRSLHITKHNRLFYKISGKKIILLNLYDTRKQNYKKPE